MSYDIEANSPTQQAKFEADTYSAKENASRMTTPTYSLPDPFADSMSHVFFSGADRRILLDEVIHLCQFGNNLVAVVGDEGVGKTSFLNQARFELSDSAFCCNLSASYGMSAESLLAQVISQLDLSLNDNSSAGEMIATLRHSMVEGNLHRVVLMIDDAHELDDGILSALISLLQGQQGHHLHILMAGNPNLVERLDGFDMVDVMVYDVTLKAFSLQETKDYLDFKLAAAGYPNALFMDDDQARQIWKESHGYPAKINTYAAALLYEQDLMEEDDVVRSGGLPLVHMGLLVVLLAGLILALLYMGGDGNDERVLTSSSQPVVPGADSSSSSSSLSLPTEQAPENTIVLDQAKTDVNKNTLEPADIAAEATAGSDLASESDSAVEEVKPASPAANTSASTNDKSDNATPLVSADQAQTASATPAPSEDNAEAKALNESQVKQRAEQEATALQGSSSSASAASAPTLPRPATSDVSTPSPSSPAPVVASAQDHQWLMGLKESDYVLQVLAASQRVSVERFIAAQPNRNSLRLLSLSRDGKPWYVVVTGNYDTNESARKAINALPQSQVNSGPWPRKVSDLKREIAAFGSN